MYSRVCKTCASLYKRFNVLYLVHMKMLLYLFAYLLASYITYMLQSQISDLNVFWPSFVEYFCVAWDLYGSSSCVYCIHNMQLEICVKLFSSGYGILGYDLILTIYVRNVLGQGTKRLDSRYKYRA